MAMGNDNTALFRSEEEVTREQTEEYLAALVREKAGLEQRLAQLKHPDAGDIPADTLKSVEADVEAVRAELARVTGGTGGEPRAKQRK